MVFILGYIIYFQIENHKYLKERANLIIGVYVLDTKRTNLGKYSDSIEYYRDLVIEFKKNKTFRLNKSVPFIADTCGIWKVGGMDEWSEIFYNNKILKFGKKYCDQISESYLDNEDSVMYINSVTPRADQFGKSDVSIVYFRKTTK